MSGVDYPAWYDDAPMKRWTLIVEIQPDAEDMQYLDDRANIADDVKAACRQYGSVVNMEWVEHDDKEEI